jgi:hypothetical protein
MRSLSARSRNPRPNTLNLDGSGHLEFNNRESKLKIMRTDGEESQTIPLPSTQDTSRRTPDIFTPDGSGQSLPELEVGAISRK